MRISRFIFIGLFLLIFSIGSLCMAAKVEEIENGVTTRSNKIVKSAKWFMDYDPSSTSFVYNNLGETEDDSGAVNITPARGDRNIVVAVPTLGSASITIRAEGRTYYSNWFKIYEQTFTAATTIGDPWPVGELAKDIRVGVKVETDGTDSIEVTGDFVIQND